MHWIRDYVFGLPYYCLFKDGLGGCRGGRQAHNLPGHHREPKNLSFVFHSQVTKPAGDTVSQDGFNAGPIEDQHYIQADTKQSESAKKM